MSLPPPATSACTTAERCACFSGSFSKSKMTAVPMPITGSCSPECGIGRVAIGCSAARPAGTQAAARAPATRRRYRRRGNSTLPLMALRDEPPRLVVLERLHDLLSCAHHEGTVGDHRLLDRHAGEEQRPEGCGRGDGDCIATSG